MSRSTRREFLRRATTVGGLAVASAVVPFSYVRASTMHRPGLDRFMENRRRAMRAPGLSAAVVGAKGLEWAGGYGMADSEAGVEADAETVHMLASVSKTVTCGGAMSVVEDGKLSLDADVNDVLPFPVAIPGYPGAVTLRQLLTQTSSLKDRWSAWGAPGKPDTLYCHGDSTIPLGDFLKSYLVPGGERYDAEDNFYDRKPGSRYGYSNIGADLAGYLAEIATGVKLSELCAKRIFEPLGMEQTGFHLADITTENIAMPHKFDNATERNDPIYQYGYPDYPSGALRTSAVQLSKWLRAFMNYGELDGTRILDEATVKEIRTDQHVAYWNQGLIWWSGFGPGFRHMGHTGDDVGITARMFFRPDRRVGAITLANSGLFGPRYAAYRDVEQHLFDVFS